MDAPNMAAAAATANKILRGPGFTSAPLDEVKPEPEDRVAFWRRFLLAIGVLSMSTTSQPKPPGMFVNFAQGTFYILVLTFIAGGFWFAYQRGVEVGDERGANRAEREAIERQREADKKLMDERLKTTEDKLEQARTALGLNPPEKKEKK
jgi:hypothetical protein